MKVSCLVWISILSVVGAQNSSSTEPTLPPFLEPTTEEGSSRSTTDDLPDWFTTTEAGSSSGSTTDDMPDWWTTTEDGSSSRSTTDGITESSNGTTSSDFSNSTESRNSTESTTEFNSTTESSNGTTSTTRRNSRSTTRAPNSRSLSDPSAPSSPWNLTYNQGDSNCVMASFATQVTFEYTDVEGRVRKGGFNVPSNATVNTQQSKCSANSSQQVLAVEFETDDIAEGLLVLTFTKQNQKSKVRSINVHFVISEELFPAVNESFIGKIAYFSSRNLNLFKANDNQSYSCSEGMKKNFSNLEIRDQDRWEYEGNELIENAAIELKDVQVQAFLPSDESVNSFMQAKVCSADQTAGNGTNNTNDDDGEDINIRLSENMLLAAGGASAFALYTFYRIGRCMG